MDFNWDNMAGNLQDNAFGEKKQYDNEVDTRFWKLARDENDNGGAVIRFLPDADVVPFVAMTKINARTKKKGFFVSEWSPTTIGLKCPFNEKFSELWNAGDKETAKTLGRGQRYITNIKVMKDPANPENEGKIFLYDMSQTMIDMLKGVMIQTDAMKALDEEPVAVFDPMKGNNFILKVKRGSNDIITYGDSKFSDKVTSIYDSEEAAEADIVANTHSLKAFLDPSNFKSYEELSDLRDKFLKIGKYSTDAATGDTAPTAEAKPETEATPEAEAPAPAETPKAEAETPKTETPAASSDDELDDLLADLG